MTTSTESAMTSRLTSEKCMPSWPMLMPSDTEMVPNCSGYPPPECTPSWRPGARRSRLRLHGVISFHELAIPICGLSPVGVAHADRAQHPARGQRLDPVGDGARAGLHIGLSGRFRHVTKCRTTRRAPFARDRAYCSWRVPSRYSARRARTWATWSGPATRCAATVNEKPKCIVVAIQEAPMTTAPERAREGTIRRARGRAGVHHAGTRTSTRRHSRRGRGMGAVGASLVPRN